MPITRILSFLVAVMFIQSVSSLSVAGEDVTWVTVEGTGRMVDSNKDEARNRALENAKFNAFYKAALSGISAESLAVNFKLSGNITGVIPYCRIADKKIMEEGIVHIHLKGKDKPVPVYKVKVKAGVVQDTERVPPEFSINSSLNKLRFKDGDKMHLNIRTTKDCYISVFNIMGNDKVLKLLPNRFKKNILISNKKPLSFPDDSDLKNGISLIAHLPDGKESVTEMLYVIALNRPLALHDSKTQEGIYNSYDGRATFFGDLIREIAGIPYNSRAESLLSYQISK